MPQFDRIGGYASVSAYVYHAPESPRHGMGVSVIAIKITLCLERLKRQAETVERFRTRLLSSPSACLRNVYKYYL